MLWCLSLSSKWSVFWLQHCLSVLSKNAYNHVLSSATAAVKDTGRSWLKETNSDSCYAQGHSHRWMLCMPKGGWTVVEDQWWTVTKYIYLNTVPKYIFFSNYTLLEYLFFGNLWLTPLHFYEGCRYLLLLSSFEVTFEFFSFLKCNWPHAVFLTG